MMCQYISFQKIRSKVFFSTRSSKKYNLFLGIVGTMHTLDVTDTVKMKEVLFGGEPWILYCSDKPGEVSSELNGVIISFVNNL